MTTALRVHNLDCTDEATELREPLQARPGVREFSFDLLRGLMEGVSLAVVVNALRLLRTGAETMIAGEVVLADREGR